MGGLDECPDGHDGTLSAEGSGVAGDGGATELDAVTLAMLSVRPGPVRVARADPAPRGLSCPFISVDDHLLEPPDMFEGRVPGRFRGRAPHVVRGEEGADWWVFEEERVPLSGTNAMVTWEADSFYNGPVSFDEVRPGCCNIAERVRDMDVNGMIASLNFPSMIFGFAGQRFMRFEDEELGLACMRAYNDWIAEEWAAPYPDRIIPAQVTWLRDPVVAAEEVRRNASRGFKAVCFSENPAALGLPSVYQKYWDPFFRACVETGTVVNLHVGSSSKRIVPSPETPIPALGCMFTMNAYIAAVDWLFAQVPLRFPDIKIVLAEGGMGWVAMLSDRLRELSAVITKEGIGHDWPADAPPTYEILHRNFFFTSYFDPTAFRVADVIGKDHILVEADYPHADSTWPDSQQIISRQLQDAAPVDRERYLWRNAKALYRLDTEVAAVLERIGWSIEGRSGEAAPTHGLVRSQPS